MNNIQRAEPAQSIVSEELVFEALNTIEKLYLDKFKNQVPEGT